MATLGGLVDLTSANDAADFMLIRDGSEPAGSRDKRISVGNLLSTTARAGGDPTFNSVTTDALVLGGSVTFLSGQVIDDVLRAAGTLAFGIIAAGASETQTLAVSGALTTHQLVWSLGQGLEDGLVAQAWISASDTVSLKLYNASASSSSAAGYNLRAVVIPFS